ncbi:MAG: hypothetical protein IKV21_05625, partial [Clostridia bacterium]|nr:hypothetical protein [Clostridia bacterium]
ISQIKQSLPAECILLMDHSARDVLDTNTELYSGSMLGCAADGFAVDTLERNEGITVDKKTDFVSVFSFFASFKKSIGDKKAVYTVDMSEYSSAYLRKMQKAGYTDFIIYSPEGIYN